MYKVHWGNSQNDWDERKQVRGEFVPVVLGMLSLNICSMNINKKWMNKGVDGEKNVLIGKCGGGDQAVQEKWCEESLKKGHGEAGNYEKPDVVRVQSQRKSPPWCQEVKKTEKLFVPF